MSRKWTNRPGGRRARIEASAPPNDPFRICGACDGFEIEAELPPGGEARVAGPKRFTLTAYTGVPMRVEGYWHPVIVDLATASAPRQSVPVPRQHDPERLLGHTTAIEISAQRIKAAGVLSGLPQHTEEVIATAKAGFPWQASIGANPGKVRFVDRGEKVAVNGRSWEGPLFVAEGATIREISLVPLGADGNTAASVAAQQRRGQMETVTPAATAATPPATPATVPPSNPTPPVQASAPPVPPPDLAAQMRAQAAAEMDRIAAVQAAAAGHPAIAAQAVREGWTPERTELQVLRASRPTPNLVIGGSAPVTSEVIEAAFWQRLRLDGTEKRFKAETLEAADKHYRHFGLQQALLMAAAMNGYHAGPGVRVHKGNLREVLEFAFAPHLRASASSTYSLAGILGNVANKELLTGWTEGDQSWREISAVKSVSDFKAATSYRLLDNGEYEELGPNGEIKHGTLSEESYTRQAKTYAKMFALTRADVINDDLGAFEDLRTRLGSGARQKFNNVFWTAFLDNASFFTSGRGNYISGSTTNLGTDGVGLGLGVKAFRQMKTPAADGAKRVGGQPSVLLVPPELEHAADALFMGEKLSSSAGESPVNTYRNKYRPVVSPWLSDSGFSGYSATAWYLLRAVAEAACMVASFLDGNESPTVESADADFNTLGIQFRGYHDFGCDKAEYIGGVKSKGAA